MASRPTTRGTSLCQRDSKLSHEIEANSQSVQDGAQTLKSHSIQKEATRIVCALLTSIARIKDQETPNDDRRMHTIRVVVVVVFFENQSRDKTVSLEGETLTCTFVHV